MNTMIVAESPAPIDCDPDREIADLMKFAAEKPTLRMINSVESRPVENWEHLYPGLWLFIEITREDHHRSHEGKLIATAENSIEFLDLSQEYRRKQILTCETHGVPLFEQPLLVPV
jgi:hypothetical protein